MLDGDSQMRVAAAGEGETLDVLGGSMTLKADGADFPVFVAEHAVPPGYFVPPHVHDEDGEMFYVLDGELTLIGDAGEVTAGPGTTVRLPQGVRHGFRNASDREVRFLVICRPGIQAAEMFRHFDRAGRAAPGGLTPPALVAIAAQYGVHMG